MRFIIDGMIGFCRHSYRQAMRLRWFWLRSWIHLERVLAWWCESPAEITEKLDDLMEQVLREEGEMEMKWAYEDD